VKHYGKHIGLTVAVQGFCVQMLRATAATNARTPGAESAAVHEWLGPTKRDVSPHPTTGRGAAQDAL
jgi:hypothetical protein